MIARAHLASMKALTGLRGVLALWVCLGHLLFNPIYNAGFAHAEDFGVFAILVRFDFIAVDLFFVMSGLLLSHLYAPLFLSSELRSRDIDRFYLKRAWRLWPMHMAMVAVIAIYQWQHIPHPISSGNEAVIFRHMPLTLFLNAVLMQAWGLVPVASWNEPAWTVSIMMFCYVLFPNIIRLVAKLRGIVVAVIAIIAVILAYAGLRAAGVAVSQTDGVGALIRGAGFFSIGCMAWRLCLQQELLQYKWLTARYMPIILAVLMGAAILYYGAVQAFPITWLHFLYVPLLLAVVLAKPEHLPLLSSAPLQFLGKIAYSLYMVHYPLLLLIKYGAGGMLQQLASQGASALAIMYVFVIFVTITVAALFHYMVERPCAKLTRKLW